MRQQPSCSIWFKDVHVRCSICGEPTERATRGKDLWTVHRKTGKSECDEGFEGCTVVTKRHVLGDGSLCPDQRHKE